MDPLKRNNPGIRATNHEDRIQALERRIFPQIQYGIAQLVDFFGNFPANDGEYFDLQDPGTEGVYGGDNNPDWAVIGNGIHVPNLDDSDGGGFFSVYCSVTSNLNLPINDPSNATTSAGGVRVHLEVWDEDENQIDPDFGSVYEQRTQTRIDANQYMYACHRMFYDRIPFSEPPNGWHAHFRASFLNDTATANRDVFDGRLTVIRYGIAVAQLG